MNSWSLLSRRVVEVRPNLAVIYAMCFRLTRFCTVGNNFLAGCQSGAAYSFDSGNTHPGWIPPV